MDIRKIDDSFSVAGQIEAEHIPAIADAGFKTIICNRPDHEGWGQPTHQQIADAAEQAGLEFRYIPVSSAGLTSGNVSDLNQALASLQKPILAYCRSGARSANLYQATSHT